jgi:DNA-binding GntR family transcriptional regulator
MSVDLVEKSYSFIRRQLLTGKLSPGSRIEEPTLALEIGVSRVPVREAIRRLESEGLVGRTPHLGAFVPVPTLQDIRDLSETREAMECYAVARACERASMAQLRDLKAIVSELMTAAREILDAGLSCLKGPLAERWVLADVAFHMAIMRIAGNRRAAKIVGDLRLMTHMIRYANAGSSSVRHVLLATVRDHAAIWRALRRRDAAAAAKLMSDHIVRSTKAILDNLPNENDLGATSADWPTSHEQLVETQRAKQSKSRGSSKNTTQKRSR